MEEKDITEFSRKKEQEDLQVRISAIKKELETVQKETIAFETLLRSHLMEKIIEEQELSVLYKKLKQEKKDKRLKQAKRGKNYKEPARLPSLSKPTEKEIRDEDPVERKRLYREAMFYSHPDKFSLAQEKLHLATEVTTKLIEIYKTGCLKELREYHLHITSGNAIEGENLFYHPNHQEEDKFLETELEKIENQLRFAKNKPLYLVLKEYEDPLQYVQELKEYYKERLFKLRKRTRKA